MLNVVCALIINEGKILACQLGSQSGHALKWEFPGGKIRTGEAPEKAIIREIREELGVEISVFFQLDSEFFDYGFKQIELIPFVCKLASGTPHLHEHINLSWFTFEELNNLELVEADRQLIRDNRKNFELLIKYMRNKVERSS